jgi:hypothetical protein
MVKPYEIASKSAGAKTEMHFTAWTVGSTQIDKQQVFAVVDRCERSQSFRAA